MRELFKDYNSIKYNDGIKVVNYHFTKAKNLDSKVAPLWANLDFCYSRYSYAKRSAFDWCEKVVQDIKDKYNLRTINKGVCSYNCMMFTYGAILVNDEYIIYLYITKEHNYIKMEER